MTTKSDEVQICMDLVAWMQMYRMAHPELQFTDFSTAFFNAIINIAESLDDEKDSLDVMNLSLEKFKVMIEAYESGEHK